MKIFARLLCAFFQFFVALLVRGISHRSPHKNRRHEHDVLAIGRPDSAILAPVETDIRHSDAPVHNTHPRSRASSSNIQIWVAIGRRSLSGLGVCHRAKTAAAPHDSVFRSNASTRHRSPARSTNAKSSCFSQDRHRRNRSTPTSRRAATGQKPKLII